MAEPEDDPAEESGLNDRLLDVFVFLPVGVAVSVAEELPRLAARGRERIGVRVSSARAVGQFAVRAGLRRSQGWSRRLGVGARGDRASRAPADATRTDGAAVGAGAADPSTSARPGAGAVNGHVPPVAALSIPGFDT